MKMDVKNVDHTEKSKIRGVAWNVKFKGWLSSFTIDAANIKCN